MPVNTPLGMLREHECQKEHIRLSLWLFFLSISVMVLIRHLFFVWLLMLFCIFNLYTSLGVYKGTSKTIWWSHKGHMVSIFLLATLWLTLPIYLAFYESMLDFCWVRPGHCGPEPHEAPWEWRQWMVYGYALLYFIGIGMMVFAEMCRYRMSAYLLAKVVRKERRAAEERMMYVTVAVGSQLDEPSEKDPQEIHVVA